MTNWHRHLTTVGLLLILAGFVFALLFGWSAGHEARLVAHDAYQPVFERIASAGGSNGEWRALEEEISRNSIAHRRAADVHGHSVNMGVLLILVALLAPLASRKDGRVLFVAAVAAVVYPVGLLLQFFEFGLAGEVVSAIGAAGAVAAMAWLCFRLSTAVDRL